MHIAIEGMDGSGKTSQAQRLAERIGGEFIAKSFHEMYDISGTYDNFVTIDKYTDGSVPGIYGIRQNYFFNKLQNKDVVTDRFYISNYWSRADDLTINYFKRISMVWGEPDLMIILYADSETLYNRIYSRNKNDKDLSKPEMSEKAYALMFKFVEKMNFDVIVIDNSSINFEKTNEIIYCAYKFGKEECLKKYPDICRRIKPNERILKAKATKFVCVENELVDCISLSDEICVPNEIEIIREKAFRHCKKNITIKIPKSVHSICAFAFEAANIDKIVVDDENCVYSSYNGVLFDKSKERLIKVPNMVNSLFLPKISVIDNCALASCKNLEKINVPDSVRKVGYAAMAFCQNLSDVIFEGKKVEYLAPGCFFASNRIRNICIDTIGYVENNGYIFDNKGNLFLAVSNISKNEVDISFGEYVYPYALNQKLVTDKLIVNVKKIGSFAFEGCFISTLCLGEKVGDIGERSFWNASIERIDIDENINITSSWNNSFDTSVNIFLPTKKIRWIFESKNWKNKRIWTSFGRKKSYQMCGNACVDYLIDNSEEETGVDDLFWVYDIVSYIERTIKMSTKVFYYKSKLMNDYNNGLKNEILDNLDDCIKEYGPFFERKIEKDELCKICQEFSHVILCVNSQILFQNLEFEGHSHYVLLQEIDEDKAIVISPGKECYYEVLVSTDDLQSMINGNGQWIIGVK